MTEDRVWLVLEVTLVRRVPQVVQGPLVPRALQEEQVPGVRRVIEDLQEISAVQGSLEPLDPSVR